MKGGAPLQEWRAPETSYRIPAHWLRLTARGVMMSPRLS